MKEAAIAALKESLPAVSLLHQKDNKTPFVHTIVKQSHFITAFTKVTPSVSKEVSVIIFVTSNIVAIYVTE